MSITDTQQWRRVNPLPNIFLRDKVRENQIFSNPVPRVGIILRTPISSTNTLKVTEDYPLNGKYIYLTVYQDASGLWGFPKGRWKSDIETYFQGAMRELKEETGVFLKHFMYKRQNEKIVIKKGKQQHHYFVIDVAVPPLVSIDNYEIFIPKVIY